ncbi:MAG: TIR domain-containing protein [Rikenellaceae bacterium]|nr:TIR domain-containing protein [Rikenellaceae bacterium]
MSENRPYDIFISYRRHGGAEYARPLKSELEQRGYSVFLDYDELKDGVFDKRIMDAIEQAPIFVFMLSAHSLDRCVNDDDWVRKEIEFAVSKKRHFVPVNPNKEFDGFPDNVPEQVKQSLGQHQFSHIDFEQLFKASVTELVVNRIQPVLSIRTSEKTQSGKGALIRIDTDLDCRILRFGKEVGTAVSGELSEIRLPKGKHKLYFVGLECEEDCTELLLDVDDLDYEDYIEIRLLDKYNARRAREAAERKAREEAERRRRLGIYAVGDYYNDGVREGVVFEVSADGRHGKIVSMKQSAEKLEWSSDSAEQKRLIGANSETDGAYNTAKVKAISGWQSKYPAFKWCADLGEGWYLPAKGELRTIYKYQDKLNPNLTDKLHERLYWSSTEADYKYSSDEFCAWDVYMYNGDTYYDDKHYYSYVRAVSAF